MVLNASRYNGTALKLVDQSEYLLGTTFVTVSVVCLLQCVDQ